MHLKNLLAFGLIGYAAAAPAVERRQASAVTTALAGLKTPLTDLETSIKAVAGTNIATEVADVVAKSAVVVTALNASSKTLSAATPWLVSDLATLSPPSRDIATITTTNIQALVAKKDVIVKGGQGKAVADALTTYKTASDAFLAEVLKKAPTELSADATTLVAPVGEGFQKAIDAFLA